MPTIDLGVAGFKSLATTGSIDAGSSLLTVASSSGFRVGDQVIVAVGGEAGHGQIGTAGVGGVYAATNSDPALYYTNTDAPKALVAHVVSVGSDGHTLTLDKAASSSTAGASVSFDNKPVWDAVVAANQVPDVTLKIPDGKFAISDYLKLYYQSGWTLEGNGQAKSTLYSPDGAPSASIEIFQASHTTLQDFSLTGNAKLNGFGLGTLETYPPGIEFTASDNGLAQNITVTDVFQHAVGTRYSNDTWAKNVDAHLTEGLARYIQWQFDWTNSRGGGVIDSSVTSPTLANGFEAFASEGVSFIGIKGTNASVSLNSSGNFLVEDAKLTVTPNSWVSDQAFHHSNPLIDVNSNISSTDPLLALGGKIVNATLIQEGYINSNENLLKGIVINSNNPNVTVQGGIYVSPDSAATNDRGASGIDSTGQNTVVDGFKVSGAGYFNIVVANGTVENSVAGTISVLPGHSINNSHPTGTFLAEAADLMAGRGPAALLPSVLVAGQTQTPGGASLTVPPLVVETGNEDASSHSGITPPAQVPAAPGPQAPAMAVIPPVVAADTHPTTTDNAPQAEVHIGATVASSQPTEAIAPQAPTAPVLPYVAVPDVHPPAAGDATPQTGAQTPTTDSHSHPPILLANLGTIDHGIATESGQFYALYEGALGRVPTLTELADASDALHHGGSVKQVAQSLAASTADAGTSSTAFIQNLYETVLHRPGSVQDVQSWVHLLNNGTSRGDILFDFALSTEHVAQLAPAFAQGVFSPNSAALDAASLYVGVLGRAPDDGGLAGWTTALDHGLSLHDATASFLSSTEFTQRGAADSTTFIDSLYVNALGRHAEADGLQGWIAASQHGMSNADIAAGIIDSSEAHQHLANLLSSWHIS